MSDFVMLGGPLPGEKTETGWFFMHRGCIKAIYPLWGVKDKRTGSYFSCSRTFEGAELPFCEAVDMEGNKYFLLPSEWGKVLSKEQIEAMKGKEKEEPKIGFLPQGQP